MNHFEPITPEHRWKNEMLNESRRTNELLEKLIELTIKDGGKHVSTEGISIESDGKGQQRQRASNRNSGSR